MRGKSNAWEERKETTSDGQTKKRKQQVMGKREKKERTSDGRPRQRSGGDSATSRWSLAHALSGRLSVHGPGQARGAEALLSARGAR